MPEGSFAENVILSGDNTDQVLNFNVINYAKTIYFANISLIQGNSETTGGGIYSAENLNIESCTITGNTATGNGGGFFSTPLSLFP